MAENIPNINIPKPDWYQDPFYRETQDKLFSFGSDILSKDYSALDKLIGGEIPDYYKPIGETGSPEFMNMLALNTRNITTAVNEDLIRRNVGRGGVGASAISKAVGDVTKNLTWADFQRALSGKQNLLNLGVQAKEYMLNSGLNTLSGVRAGALDITGKKNQFGLSNAQLALQEAIENKNIGMYNAGMRIREEEREDDFWNQILTSSIGAIGTIGGAMIGGPTGAAVGGTLGSAISSELGSGAKTGMPGFDWTPPPIYGS